MRGSIAGAVFCALFAVLASSPRVADAAEFRVNAYQTNDQSSPAVATLTGGGSVAVWTSSGQDGSGYGVYAQCFTAGGTKSGAEFRVNTATTNDQWAPAVAPLSGGGFVIVWASNVQLSVGFDIRGQRYTAAGGKVGSEFLINTFRAGTQGEPAAAGLANNTFVVTWTSENQDGSGFGVYGQRFAANATKAGSEFRVNTYTPGSQSGSDVSAYGTNRFVVAWSSAGQDGSGRGVYAQRYAASSGAKYGNEFRVNTLTDGTQYQPAITRLKNSEFVIVFSSERGSAEVRGQRYTTAGVAVGAQFQANTHINSDQSYPDVAGTAGGGFVVTWTSNLQDGSEHGIYGQRYTAAGGRSGVEFRTNEVTQNSQALSSVAAWKNGFFVLWRSEGQDLSGTAVIGRRFAN